MVLSESADGKVNEDWTETALSDPLTVASKDEEDTIEINSIKNMPMLYSQWHYATTYSEHTSISNGGTQEKKEK